MIWLIGNQGMLGREVEQMLQQSGKDYCASDIEVDITAPQQLHDFACGRGIDYIVNCSAYTMVDKAEAEPQRANAVNGAGVANIASVAYQLDATLFHISTDYVFNGEQSEAYRESDPPAPTSAYGYSKLLGERAIHHSGAKAFIVRISWLYGRHGNNFVYTMLRLFAQRDSVNVVNDQFGSPTYSRDVAVALGQMLDRHSSNYGIYHFTNAGRTTWYRFATAIYERGRRSGLISKEVQLVPITTADYPTPAKRPKYSYLSKEKIQQEFGLAIRPWESALDDFLEAEKK